MSFKNQYSGSPWQQGGPPFGVGSYIQNYGGYNDQFSHQMMNSGYNHNQGYGGMYGSGGMVQMRNMGKGSDQNRKKKGKPKNWCRDCNCEFNGNFLTHQRTKEHKKQHFTKHGSRCRSCRLRFSKSEEYRDHCKSEEHKQKCAAYRYSKNLAFGSDDEEDAIQPVKNEDEPEDDAEIKMKEETTEEAVKTAEQSDSESQEKTVETKNNAEKKEKNTDAEKEEVKKKSRELTAVGQSFVVSAKGYYCKLCHKFFKDVKVAKFKHCRSIMHSEAFKKAMEDVVELEKDRKRLLMTERC